VGSRPTAVGPREPQDRDGELDGLDGRPVDRVAEPFQQVRFNVAPHLEVDRSRGPRDVAKSGQQQAGQPDRPLAAMLDGESDKLMEDGQLEAIAC
jgi:hypothetical protein